MRSILIVNAKGGCGKTTLATNLAGYYAARGKRVVLADFDPQGSSLHWVQTRPADRPEVIGIAAWAEALRLPRDAEYLIMDAPSGVSGGALAALVRRAETLLVPLLPSPIDIRAANNFLQELAGLKQVGHRRVRLATIANRVRENTLAAEALTEYLSGLTLPDGRKLPFITELRASTNYLRAAERGLSVLEMAPSATLIDREQWLPLLRWLGSARSLPAN